MNPHIVNKYNNLFAEATLYYGISKSDIHIGECGLYVVYADYLGFHKDITDANVCREFVHFLNTSYEYLAPFYWFYYSHVRWAKMKASHATLVRINTVIKQIREENKDTVWKGKLQ